MSEISDENEEHKKKRKSRIHRHSISKNKNNNENEELNLNGNINENNNENKMDLYPRRFSSYFQNEDTNQQNEDKKEKNIKHRHHSHHSHHHHNEETINNYDDEINKKGKRNSLARNNMIDSQLLNIQKPKGRNKMIEIGIKEEKKIIKDLKKKESNNEDVRLSRVFQNYNNHEKKRKSSKIGNEVNNFRRFSKFINKTDSNRNIIELKINKEELFQLSSGTIKKINRKCPNCNNDNLFIYIPQFLNQLNIKTNENKVDNQVTLQTITKTEDNLINRSNNDFFYPILVCINLHQFCSICIQNLHSGNYCNNLELDSKNNILRIYNILEKDIPEEKKEIFNKMKEYSLTKINKDNSESKTCSCKCCEKIPCLKIFLYLIMGLTFFCWTIVALLILVVLFCIIIVLLFANAFYYIYDLFKNIICSEEKIIEDKEHNVTHIIKPNMNKEKKEFIGWNLIKKIYHKIPIGYIYIYHSFKEKIE